MGSAAWTKEVECLAKEFLGAHITLSVGSKNLPANHYIQQIFDVRSEEEKYSKLSL